MRYRAVWLFLPLTALSAAEDSLANLVYFNDRLELHPRVGLAARYDSNVTAESEEEQDEFAGIGLVGLELGYAWSEVTTLTADGEAQLVLTDRPEQRWRNQGVLDLAALRQLSDGNVGARVGYARTDDPDEQTGERLLVDRWSAGLTGEHTGAHHRWSGGLSFDRSDYQDDSRSFSEDERDENTYALTAGYGLRLDSGDEASLRVIGDHRDYDHANATNQDSLGLHALIGWNRQVSEAVGLSLELGAEYRRYERNAVAPADDIIGPTWLVDGRTVTASESTWSLTLSGGIEDTISGNPALVSRAVLAWMRPMTPSWSLNASAEGFQLDDLESVAGQPTDHRWTVRGVLGTAHLLRPGLTADVNGGYEYSDSEQQGDYDRIVVRGGITARF